MKVELGNYCPTTVVADLENGETFLHRSTGSNDDSIFMVIDRGGFNWEAVDLATGEVITLEEDETVIPIKTKVIVDRQNGRIFLPIFSFFVRLTFENQKNTSCNFRGV